MSASMNDVKARMKSVKSTLQLTGAMELVAASKLRRAGERAEESRPFYEGMKDAVLTLSALPEAAESVYFRKKEGKTLYILMAGDRGLAGGFNANIFRLAAELAKGNDALYLPVGKKAVEHCRHKGYPVFAEALQIASAGVGRCLDLAREISRAFAAGELARVVLVYTKYVSMLTQTPVSEEILPLSLYPETRGVEPIFEGETEEMLSLVIPDYLGGLLYAAACESQASECGARRNAMNAANKNAGEMLDALALSYNRARQAVITQELTEIVSGAEAL